MHSFIGSLMDSNDADVQVDLVANRALPWEYYTYNRFSSQEWSPQNLRYLTPSRVHPSLMSLLLSLRRCRTSQEGKGERTGFFPEIH
jgi:hypothetical protein